MYNYNIFLSKKQIATSKSLFILLYYYFNTLFNNIPMVYSSGAKHTSIAEQNTPVNFIILSEVA